MQNVVKWTDVRSLTYQERLKIGFNEVKLKWQNAKAHFTDSALQICGHPVMEDWEKDYMKLLADIATTNHGVVLEVGFGLGLSAGYIQQNQIDKHIIMEANKGVYLKALEFAQKAKYQTDIIFGFWEDTISQVKDNSLDGILFDTYPLVPDEVHQNHFSFFKHANRILKPGGILTYYSDEMTDFAPEHIKCLNLAGFNKISGKLCDVEPPKDCQYWKSNTILAPIIIK